MKASSSAASVIGLSLSPGGLLLPYHLGVLDGLQHLNVLQETTPLAGASAGAIATASKAAGLKGTSILDVTMQLCDTCGGQLRGRLLPLLKHHLNEQIKDEQFDRIVQRPGRVGIAYKQVFPKFQNILQTDFSDRNDLMNAVTHSSYFPFFTGNTPVALDLSSHNRFFPRLMLDGVFTVPLERIGCPDFNTSDIDVDRTIRISVIPQALVVGSGNKGDKDSNDCISPTWQGGYQLSRLIRLAYRGGSDKELSALYESGWKDTERWHRREQEQQQQQQQQQK